MYRKAIYWFLFLYSQACPGQDASTPLHFDHLTINEGLSHNTVYSILQDHYGYIWIGTQNGLNKYDGYFFEVYPSKTPGNDPGGFKGTYISSLFEDRDGNLWVGTRKHGINFKPNSSDRFINLQSDPAFTAIKGFEISSFFEDKAGNIWITTVGAGILKYDPKNKNSTIYNNENSHLSSNVAFDILEDKYGIIWAATAGGGLNYLVNDDRFALSHEMLPNHPNMGSYRKKLLLDDDHLWIGTEGTGIYKMNLKDRSYIHFAPGNRKRAISSNVVRDMHKTKDGRLFIATDGKGLHVYNTATEDMSLFDFQVNEKNSLNSNSLLCMRGDRTGNIWIGTFNGGINIYKPNKTWFGFFTPSSDRNNVLQHRSVLSILERQDGKILAGMDGGGLHWLNQQNNQFEASSFKNDPADPNSIAGNVVKTLFEDSQNRLWIGMFGAGLDLYDPATESFRHIIDWRPNVWSIAEKKDGNLLVATMGAGISVVHPKTLQVSPFQPESTRPNNLGDPNIMTVFVDRADRTWIGSAENGLDMIDETNTHAIYCRHVPQDSFSISNNAIRTIYQDNSGEIWIGTEGGGLNRWLGEERFERITQKDGLISNSVMGIAEDNQGFIWITTFEGISRLNKKTKVIWNFNFRNSENTNQFNQNAILAGTNGQLFFGGIYGVNTIRPEKVVENDQKPALIFTDLKIYNKKVPVGKLPDGRVILEKPIEQSSEIRLNYQDQSFSIAFTAIDYTHPFENVFAYKMEGFNEAWQNTSPGQHSATYTNLDPGTYTFRIKHKEKLASIHVYIKPPYWQTIWFRSLAVLFSLGFLSSGLYFWIKRREAAHKRKILQLENEKLATEVEAKNSKLMFSSVQMAHKNEILTEVKKDLIDLGKTPERNVRPLVRKLNRELMNEDYWNEFNLYFNEVDQKFIDKILKKHPKLTQNDLRMCSLLRLNLSTKEIASLLNISTRAVEQGRYRLKKRLGLDKEEDLLKYIASFDIES